MAQTGGGIKEIQPSPDPSLPDTESTSPQQKPGKKAYDFSNGYIWLRGLFDRKYGEAYKEHLAAKAKAEEQAELEAKARAEAEEHAKREATARKEAERQRCVADIKEYSRCLREDILKSSGINLSAAVVNSKGGVGKTPLAVYLSSTLGEFCRRSLVLCDHNPMLGTTASLLGLIGYGGLSVRKVAHLLEQGELTEAGRYLSMLPTTKHGVTFVNSDDAVAREDFYDEQTAAAVIQVGRRHAQLNVHDTGNGIQTPGMFGILNNSNVLLVPTAMSIAKMQITSNTLYNLREWGFKELVDNCIIVIMGLPEGSSLDTYRALYAKAIAKLQKGVFELSETQTLLAVPYDERLAVDEVADLDQTDFYTRLAFEEVALATLRTAIKVEHPEYTNRGVLRSGQLVELPSGGTPVLPWNGYDRLIPRKEIA